MHIKNGINGNYEKLDGKFASRMMVSADSKVAYVYNKYMNIYDHATKTNNYFADGPKDLY